MCGIVGYIGDRQARSILLNCLSKLEYRGYDSCGIAVAVGGVKVFKDVVRVQALIKAAPRLEGVVGIGHTRWATHGEPTQLNAHPHVDCSGNIAVVHNGVITNYQSLRHQLTSEGHRFVSETDTEVIPHLIEKHFNGNLEAAVEAALQEIEGSYAIAVVMAGQAKLVVARKESPLVIGVGDREYFVASDVPAFLDYTSRVIYLEDGDVATITGEGMAIRSNGKNIHRPEQKVLWSVEEAKKGGYEHFMLKEIHEQPRVIRNTLGEYTRDSDSESKPSIKLDDSVLMLACGTSYHAGLTGKYILEELLKVPVTAELASEFNYYAHALPRALTIAITQSGETADTLKAMKRMKEIGSRIVAVTNVVGSTASRVADQVIYTRAGPEMSVAATKSFTAQLMVFYWLAISHSKADVRTMSSLLLELKQLPSKVQQVLDGESTIMKHANYLAKFPSVIYVGRGINYPIALEGALKLKEIAYIHAEGYAAGETKHGPFALLGSDTPVIAVVGKDRTYEAMLTNIKEMKARKSPVIAIAEEGDHKITELADAVISVPRVDPLFSPVVNTVVLQLLAYYTAKVRGCPIDFPRNLAKSVTVE